MRIKDCVLKYLPGTVWLHHTASGYKVRLNDEAVAVLESMAARLSSAEMTEKERFIYGKLRAQGIAAEDTGRAEDRRVPVKRGSRLESLELEFSGRCNLRCAHCFSALSQADMPLEVLRAVFEGVDALEPVNLIINGGEAMLNPLLPEALSAAERRRMRVTLMTNGTLINQENAALLGERRPAKVVVSLDFFEDTHDAIRGAGAFRKTVAGIGALVALRVPVFVTAMVQRNTAARLEEFQRFCLNELGASGVRFSSVMPIGRGKDAPELALTPSQVRELFRKGSLAGSDGGDAVFSRLAGERAFHCGAGISECFVSADGKVYACHYFQNIGETMGDLAGASLADIYAGYPASGAAPVGMDWEKLEGCRSCESFSACKGGCRARAKLLAGNWHAPDPYSCCMYGRE